MTFESCPDYLIGNIMVYREEANKRIRKLLKGKTYSFQDYALRGKFRIDSITMSEVRIITPRISVDGEWWTRGGEWYSPPVGTRFSKKTCNERLRVILRPTIENLLIMIGIEHVHIKDVDIKWTKFNK